MIRPILIFFLAASPGIAEPVLSQNTRECIINYVAADSPYRACVQRAHSNCLAWPIGSTAGTACFVSAKAEWGARISERMAEIAETEPEEIRMIAGIEVKYDLQEGLLSCDRQYELSLVTRDPDDEIAYARARCEAEAVAFGYVALLGKSNALRPE